MISISPQTFQWSKGQGGPSTFGFKTTKIELNHVLLYKETPFAGGPPARSVPLDYTLTTLTNGLKESSRTTLINFWQSTPGTRDLG